MLGSQALDTAVGLVLLFFVLATAASSLLELATRLARKRSKDLEREIGELLGGTGGGGAAATSAIQAFKRTTVYAGAVSASGGSPPAYLSAKSFADAALELASDVGQSPDALLPSQLSERLATLLDESGNDPLQLRAGLERWFDEAMSRLTDAYKRQATLAVGALGFLLAVATNASTPDVAARLWTAPVTREAVVAAASNVGKDSSSLAEVARVTQSLTELTIPLGWVNGQSGGGIGWWLGHLVGWALTGLLVMVGAPFWFDLLSRLISFRGSSGGAPPRADQDPAAATPRVLARDANPGLVAAEAAPAAPAAAAANPLIDNVRKAIAKSAAPSPPRP